MAHHERSSLHWSPIGDTPACSPPTYAHPADAGADLCAARGISLAPGERAVVPTGVAIALEPGTAGLIVPRSGLAARYGVTVANAPGLIDAGYRGELKVALINLDAAESFTVHPGDRIAQLVVISVLTPTFVRADDLETTVRGASGFGSTGGLSGGEGDSSQTEL